MFVDVAKVEVRAGDGGRGMVAYRREKYVPLGGPAGGDGGRGGDVVFVVDEGLRTLLDFRYQRLLRASGGEPGRAKNQHGANAEDLLVGVPPGTVVKEAETGEIVADLTQAGDRAVMAKGGRGGRGNAHFANARNKAPDMAERGEPGQVRTLILELRLLADVGLVGFPSVGKSTLLASVSAARPKIADYPFTTLTPNLGVVAVRDERSFVMADLPGLIEGAHAGAGLGHEFLRHIERTRVLIHVVDMAPADGRDPVADYLAINQELRLYREALAGRPQIVAANKMDIPEAEDALRRFRERFPEALVYPVSAATGSGVDRLVALAADLLEEESRKESTPDAAIPEGEVVYKPNGRSFVFRVVRDQGQYVVESAELEKLVTMTNFEQDDAVARFQRIMRRSGVDDALRAQGAKDGDQIRIGDMEFDFVD